jgi:hypothetical protein
MRIQILGIAAIALLCAFVPVKKKAKAKTTKKTTTITTSKAIADSAIALSTDSAYWYKISFISKGAGPDSKAIQTCAQTIANFEKSKKVTVPYKLAQWGREGEKDFCIALGQLSKKDAEAFKTEMQDALIHCSLVLYKANCKCDKYREVVPEQD